MSPIGAGAVNFQRPSIVDHPRNWPAHYRHAANFVALCHSNAEFRSRDRIVMPMMLPHECISLI
jgi:hypothetical protein